MRTLSIDIETYSDLDLKAAGAHRYALSPAFEVLLIGWSLDGGPVRVSDLSRDGPEKGLIDALYDSGILKTAYNAAFEITCLNAWLTGMGYPPMDLRQWEDTMLLAAYNGYTGSLEKVGEALGLSEGLRKDAAGTALINRFSKPRRPTKSDPRKRVLPRDDPEAWRRFIEYNRQDVTAEMAIRERLIETGEPIPPAEQLAWRLDLEINARGVGVDMGLVESALRLEAEERKRLKDGIASISGVTNPKSGPQMKAWLSGEMGREVKTLTKETVPGLIAECREKGLEEAADALEMRQELEKTSLAKYRKIADMACPDGRVRGMLQFYGSRTGRWAGRGVQVQNLPRNSIPELAEARGMLKAGEWGLMRLTYGPNLSDTASQLIRTAFVPAEGMAFAVADYSAIEARVIAWLSGEAWRVETFRRGGDIYIASAAQMFGVSEDLIKDKSRPEHNLRAQGKVAELALGYGGGAGAIARMDYAGAIPEKERPRIVKSWRGRSPRIVSLWAECENAAVAAVSGEGPVEAAEGRLEFSLRPRSGALSVRLPSGRRLLYPEPRIGEDRWGRPSVTFLGINQASRKFERIETYGGKLVENIVQAIARDCLSQSLVALDGAGFEVAFHVHDEVIAEVPAGSAKERLSLMEELMCREPNWAPGLPLSAAGFTSEFYMKD